MNFELETKNSLFVYPELTDEQTHYVVDSVIAFYRP